MRAHYDAFVSYSRQADARVAEFLQRGLQQFAKPWYRLRILHVFRDDVSLSANPGLWSSITEALNASDYFILLASAPAATSEWVSREVDHWLQHADARRLLIVVTEGELRWDRTHNDFDWSLQPPLPPPLRGAYGEEPRYVDLRWVRREEHLSLRDPRFREAIADLASTIRDTPKDQLVGEDVRQHRRALRLARGGVTTLALLTAAAVTLALLAVQGRNRANAQAALATSRALAAEAENAVGDGRLDVGLIFGAQAYALRPSAEARSALAAALMASGRVRHVIHEQPIELADVSTDGRRLAVVRRDGPIVVWDLATGRIVGRSVPLSGRPMAIALSPRGRMLAIGVARVTSIKFGSGSTKNQIPLVVVWDVDRGRFVLSPSEAQAPGIGISVPNVAVTDTGNVAWTGGRPGLAEVDFWSGRRSSVSVQLLSCDIVMNADGSLLASVNAIGRVGAFTTEVRVFRLGRAGIQDEPVASFVGRPGTAPGTNECGPAGSAAFDPSRPEVLAIGGWDGQVRLWEATSGRRVGLHLKGRHGLVSAVRFSPDGSRLLIQDEGGETIRNVADGSLVHDFLSTASSDRGVWFGRTSRILVTAGSAGTIALSDQHGDTLPLGTTIRTKSPVSDVAYEPKTSRIALAESGGVIEFYDTSAHMLGGETIQSHFSSPHIVYSDDGNLLLAWEDHVARVWEARSGAPIGGDVVDHTTRDETFAISRSGAVVAIHQGIGDATLVPLRPRGRAVSLQDSSDVQKSSFDASSNRILLETIWGTGVWDARTGRPIGRPLPAGTAAMRPDGRVVAVGESPGTIDLWEVATGRRLLALSGSTAPTALAFDPDGGLLAASAAGIEVWDTSRESLLGDRPLYDHGVTKLSGADVLAFSPSGRTLISSGFGGRPLLWDVNPRAWQAQACDLVTWRLSKTEWRERIGSARYAPVCTSHK